MELTPTTLPHADEEDGRSTQQLWGGTDYEPTTCSHTAPVQPLWRVIVFCCLPIGINMATWFSTGVLFPIQVADYIGQGEKANLLAALGIVIAVACLPFGSLAGYLSDHLLTRVGKRQPWLMFATLLAAISMTIRPLLPITVTFWFGVNFVLTVAVKISFTILNSIFLAMVSDTFHESQLGLVGSVNSFIGLLAGGFGVSLLGFLFPIVGSVATCSITVAFMLVNIVVHGILFREDENHRSSGLFGWKSTTQKPSLYGSVTAESVFSKVKTTLYHLVVPLCIKDFMLITLSQFLIILSFESVTTFALYYLHDKIGPEYVLLWWDRIATSPEQALSFLMLVMLLSALIVSVLMSILADRISRRKLLFVFGSLGVVGTVILAIFQQYNWVLFSGIFLGACAGGVLSGFLGLIVDVVKDKTPDHIAQNMALFYLGSSVLPKVLSNVVGGGAIAIGNWLWEKGYVRIRLFGYNLLFIIATVLTICGNVLILFMSSSYDVRRKQHQRNKAGDTTTPQTPITEPTLETAM